MLIEKNQNISNLIQAILSNKEIIHMKFKYNIFVSFLKSDLICNTNITKNIDYIYNMNWNNHKKNGRLQYTSHKAQY